MADYFLRIEGIDGESTDAKHKGEIEISSFSWGVTNTSTGAVGGGGGAGKAVFQDIHFVAQSSKASPKLFLACAQGEHIKKAVLSGRRTGGPNQADFLTFTLSDILVSSYQIADGAQENRQDLKIMPSPADQFSLNFAKIEFELNGQKASWDVRSNTKF